MFFFFCRIFRFLGVFHKRCTFLSIFFVYYKVELPCLGSSISFVNVITVDTLIIYYQKCFYDDIANDNYLENKFRCAVVDIEIYNILLKNPLKYFNKKISQSVEHKNED